MKQSLYPFAPNDNKALIKKEHVEIQKATRDARDKHERSMRSEKTLLSANHESIDGLKVI